MRAGLALQALLLAALFAGTALAQTVSRSTYVKLLGVQELWEAEDYTAALAELRELTRKTGRNPYDHAVVHQYLAQTAIFAGEADAARKALEVALAIADLPLELVVELKLFYGQLVLGDGEYELARQNLEAWYRDVEGKKPPAAVFSLAYANYETAKLARAQLLIEEAMGAVKRAPNSWHRLYYQVLFELEKFAEAEAVLFELLNRAPDDDSFWRMLVNHHLQRNDGGQALAAMAIAYQQGLVTDARDLARLVSLYSYVAVPEKAARLLQEFLSNNRMEETPETLRQLGDLWLLAREREEALHFLQRAAEIAPDGKTYELLGGLYFEDEEWAKAYQQFERAIELGTIDDEPRIQFLAGVSAMRAGLAREAREALGRARESAAFKEQAAGLLRRLDN